MRGTDHSKDRGAPPKIFKRVSLYPQVKKMTHTPKTAHLSLLLALFILASGCGGAMDVSGGEEEAPYDEAGIEDVSEVAGDEDSTDEDGEDYFFDEEEGDLILEPAVEDTDGDEDFIEAPGDATVEEEEVMIDPETGFPIGAERGKANTSDSTKVVMTYTTANIGRNYRDRGKLREVFGRLLNVLGSKNGPKLIGWQEINEADPCGEKCEIQELTAKFNPSKGWYTKQPRNVKVPNTAKGAGGATERAVFASPGWAGVSPTRYVTVTYYSKRNVSLINTHLIAGAWSCKGNAEKRRDYWRQSWQVLKQQVAKEHAKGRNVIVTGDLNRPRGANRCNPSWDPTSLHKRARIIGGEGIDYIFAVPAARKKFVFARNSEGKIKRGNITIGIDGHKAHWVRGKFVKQ